MKQIDLIFAAALLLNTRNVTHPQLFLNTLATFK